MRPVVFVAPFPLETTLEFVRAVASLPDVRLLAVVTKPPPAAWRRLFADMVTLPDCLDTGQLLDAVRLLQHRHGKIHRLLGILEPLQEQLAEVRRALGIEGTPPEVAVLFRDKGRMKDALRAHGLPCARYAVVHSADEARAFVARAGFPLVLKPTEGMGCRATYRIQTPEALDQALRSLRVSAGHPALLEEFLTGREYSFDTLVVDGQVRFHSFTRYLPTPLEVMENPWMQWCVLHPRHIQGEGWDDAADLGRRVIQALGLRDGFTHMEWFRRQDGSMAIGEIAARPPGAMIVAGNNWVHDADLHCAWARAVVDRAFDGPWSRKYAVGVAFLRGMGHGRVARVRGVKEAQQQVGPLVVAAKLPTVGAPRADSYEGDGWVAVRHPDEARVMQALKTLVERVKVDYVG
jgi:hypothetical protein